MIRSATALLAVAVCCLSVAASDDDSTGMLVIGLRRDSPAQKNSNTGAAANPAGAKKEWFKSGLTEAALHNEALAAARALGSAKGDASELDDVREGVVRERDRCVKEFVWMLNWNNCPDPTYRRGALAGIGICNLDPKVTGRPLATSAIYEPDEIARKAAIDLIKTRKDLPAGRAMVDTWKAAFDEQGVLDTNEPQRKAAVAAMREVGDKRVFQALLYYAMLEIHAGSAKLVGVNNVAITGQRINLPIDLPVLDLVSANGNIIVPAMSSLKGATGQDFGHNWDKWQDWIKSLP